MAFLNRRKQELQDALEKLEAAEQTIRDLETNIATIEQSVAMLIMSRDGFIESVSDRFTHLLGHQPQALAGQHHRVICDENYANSEDYMKFWQALVIGNSQHGRFAGIDGEGNSVWLEARYAPIMSEKGMVQRVIAIVTDTHRA